MEGKEPSSLSQNTREHTPVPQGGRAGTLPPASALGFRMTTTFASDFLNKEAADPNRLFSQKAHNTATAEELPFMLAP